MQRPSRLLVRAAAAALLAGAGAVSAGEACQARSGTNRTPVLELYTSEGCSSCPPADRFVATLKPLVASGRLVVQAFHVGYWDSLGWADRFASPAHTGRQREWAARHRASNIYTPQLVRDGADWRDYSKALDISAEPAAIAIELASTAGESVEATVSPAAAGRAWSAYWTVTENGHRSKVGAGENAGELLQHDFVVRQYVPAGQYTGAQKLRLRTVAATPGHTRQVNLVVFDPANGKPLQALGVAC